MNLLCVAACSDDTSSDGLEPLDAALHDGGSTGEADAAPTGSTAMPDAGANTAPADAATPPADASASAPDSGATTSDAGLGDAAISQADAALGPSDAAVPSDAAIGDASMSDADAGADASLEDAASPILDLGTKALVDLADVAQHPNDYEWFDFKPNVKKLILAGAPETRHIAILWYTVTDGAVGLHYHAKTECVYVIDGTQTDAKGVYPTGTVYYNPPTSGHAISDSSGFFLLSYAAPPDFTNTDLIEDYTPVRIDTEDPELLSEYAFDSDGGVSTYAVPLDAEGGMSSELIALGATEAYTFSGNYLLVLEGTCKIDGQVLAEDSLVVTHDVVPETFSLGAPDGADCLAMGISF
jgi:hypothetical protein